MYLSPPCHSELRNVASVAVDGSPVEILNLGGAETTALKDLVLELARLLAVEPRIDYLPEQPGDVPITYADVSKAHRLLGYSPHVPIRQGLERFPMFRDGMGLLFGLDLEMMFDPP